MSASKLRVTQVKSEIGRMEKQRRVLRGLGLRGPNTEVVVTPTVGRFEPVGCVTHRVVVSTVPGQSVAY